MNKPGPFLRYRLPVIALCLAIFWQSSYPGIIHQQLFLHQDKVLHFAAYAVLAFLTARSLFAGKPHFSTFKIQVIAILFSSLFGASDEVHQAFVPQRSASTADFAADLAGSLMGAMVLFRFYLYCFKQGIMHK